MPLQVKSPNGYHAVLENDRSVVIYDPNGRYVGTGRWRPDNPHGQIDDCSADLGSIYDDLDYALSEAGADDYPGTED